MERTGNCVGRGDRFLSHSDELSWLASRHTSVSQKETNKDFTNHMNGIHILIRKIW